MRFYKNTDTVDIDSKCLGISNDEGYDNRGLSIQIRHNGNKQLFEEASKLQDIIVKALNEHFEGICESCENKGYIEVTYDDGQYIEACETCDYFGIIQTVNSNQINKNAWDKAKSEGYKLTKNGKIK